ncbi:NADH:flavin oxidoreductase [Alkaliphilus hydrothermalis]|uniref:2,4-dienoyl-CoA reductase-like NADH-dependent reductase (Old Yellow Enzyme family) n=1 Tax=Alkaliphilus hydrothermalis TaxID=1482730 RepID=A0ABS2NQ18_9FIRM|nr:NADH:flavin oxidoreductase [Alkaliphilus hydrothermalis]MBM7614946.1 2,4-dienoyl-CoA reductase-like NADH-dependent reductase (Old Yellow Enzyme family) [Alkaliphilus hydrothermalis]
MTSVIDRSIMINKKKVKNRILMPPLVCFNWGNEEGFETVDRAEHYALRAKGGTGLMVVEATAISREGRITDTGIGLWRDEHIPQFERMAHACHQEDSVVIVQLVHAGMKAVGTPVYSSSAVEVENKQCLELSLEHIERIKAEFIEAALRAQKAGLDGVEIHGAHGYLLSQFTSKQVNARNDQYGGSLDNRLRLSLEIVEGVRKATGDDFIICYRFGVNDPTLEEDKYFAKKLEALGVDILNVSAGIGANSKNLVPPEDYPYSFITYMGTEIFKQVDIPVACVFGIKEPKQAEYLLENEMIDMVAVGKGLLADPNWTNKAIKGEGVNICYNCAPWCKYGKDGKTCPWYGK